MPTVTRGAEKDPSDGTPKNSAPADVTIAGPFDDGEADFDDRSGAGMGTAEETDQMLEMVGAAEGTGEGTGQIAKMGAIWQGPMAKMKVMQATISQMQSMQADDCSDAVDAGDD